MMLRLSPVLPAFASILLGSALCGCAAGEPPDAARGTSASRTHAQAPELDAERLALSEGYSLLYRDSSHLDRIDLLLYAKSESDRVEVLVEDVADFAATLKARLEQIDRDYPGVRIDLDPLPEMEERKRRSIALERAGEFAPIVGRGGVAYERTVLIGLHNGINHQRALCRVLAEAETDAGLEQFLLATRASYDTLYERIGTLLDAVYFRTSGETPGH
ncbi:MAG: hypothetical protein R3F21_22185 [Myxococcota bacterium]